LQNMDKRRGATFIDLMIATGIMVMLFAGIYMVYFSLVDAVSSVDSKNAAASALSREMEIIRNLPYEKIGISGGFPSGVIPATQNVSVGGYDFTLKTLVRNIDDPYDGTISSSPKDTAPADYKLVELTIECATCNRFAPMSLSTISAPKNLEASGSTGSLNVNVFDASGNPLPGITVHILNSSTTPTMELVDTTGANGLLQLVGLPTSTQSYQISVYANGYSADKTYPLGLVSNPNPLMVHATVAEGQVTNVSFSVDKLSSAQMLFAGPYCDGVSGVNLQISGTKLIGQGPDVLKYSTTTTSDSSGQIILPNLEWDSYNATATASGFTMVASDLHRPFAVSPSTTISGKFMMLADVDSNLAVLPIDQATGDYVADAIVDISRAAYSDSEKVGYWEVSDTNWSGSDYSAIDGIDTEGSPGEFSIAPFAGPYPTGTTFWLESKTMDFGALVEPKEINVDFVAPGSAGLNSILFQLASNNDNSTWNYVGPDGTGFSYYDNNAQISNLSSGRYLRYKVFMKTDDEDETPTLRRLGIKFKGGCVIPNTAYFPDISQGAYDISINAPGYNQATSSFSVFSGWNKAQILMQKI